MDIKVSAFSDDLSSVFAQAAALAAEAGVDGLAVRNVGGQNVSAAGNREVGEIKRIAESYGLEISALASQVGRNSFLEDEGSGAAAAELLRPVVGHAAFLGVSTIRVFGPWLKGQDPLERWAERPPLKDRLEEILEWFAPSLALAQDADITLMVELEGASFIGQVAEARELLLEARSPVLALCWDVCNGWWSGELPLQEALGRASGLPIMDVQTKDVRIQPGKPDSPAFDQMVLGEGDIPYREIISGLLAMGYEGWFTAERVYHPRKPEQDPLLQKNMLGDIRALRSLLSEVGQQSRSPRSPAV